MKEIMNTDRTMKQPLRVEHLYKKYGTKAVLKDCSFSLSHGLHGFLGPNEAGKTTLLRLLAGVVKPDRGEILYCGQSIGEMGAQYSRRLGYLPQNFGFYPDLTVEEYLYYIASLKGLRPIVMKRDTRRLLEEYQLAENKDSRMEDISGGQQERAGIIQALLGGPEILLLDEPFASQDAAMRNILLERMHRYAESHIVVISTHLVEEVSGWADKVVTL